VVRHLGQAKKSRSDKKETDKSTGRGGAFYPAECTTRRDSKQLC